MTEDTQLQKSLKGFSLLELIIASALLGIVLAGTFSVFTTSTDQIGSITTTQKNSESQKKAFQIFYATLNQSDTDFNEDLADQAGNQLTVNFVTGSQTPAVTGTSITIGNADSNLSGEIVVTPISQHTYDEDEYCRVTSQNSNQTFNYTCPGTGFNGVVEASTRNGNIAFLSGEICQLSSTQTTQTILALDNPSCLSLIPNQTDTSAWEGTFIVPIVVATSPTNTNPKSVFTSLSNPDARISTAYPTL